MVGHEVKTRCCGGVVASHPTDLHQCAVLRAVRCRAWERRCAASLAGRVPAKTETALGCVWGAVSCRKHGGLRMKGACGIYRVRRIGGLGSDARVTDTTTVMDVPESVYRARGYQPDFDTLPWQDEYHAKKSSEKR